MYQNAYAYPTSGMTVAPWASGVSIDWFVRAHARADRRHDAHEQSSCIFADWYRSAVERRKMRSISDEVPMDIGVGRSQMLREAGKPFWRA